MEQRATERFAPVALSFSFHPKMSELRRAGPTRYGKAVALWLLARLHADRESTGGVIPATDLRMIYDTPDVRALADLLVKAELWEQLEHGYQIHDFESSGGVLGSSAEPTKRSADQKRRERNRKYRANHPKPAATDAPRDGETVGKTSRETPRDGREDVSRDGRRDGETVGKTSRETVGETPRDGREDVSRDAPLPRPPLSEDPRLETQDARETPRDGREDVSRDAPQAPRETQSRACPEALAGWGRHLASVSPGALPEAWRCVETAMREMYARERPGRAPWRASASTKRPLLETAELVTEQAAKSKLSEEAVVDRVMEAFSRDTWSRERDWPVAVLPQKFGQFFLRLATTSPPAGGLAKPASAAEHERESVKTWAKLVKMGLMSEQEAADAIAGAAQ